MAITKKKQSTAGRFNQPGKTSAGEQLNSPKQIEDSRKTLAPGGGQPIGKGKKWTNEKRVLQPRDEEGHFDYNSSAGYERKYEYHAERNGSHGGAGGGGKYKTLPTYARDNFDIETCIQKGMKKGDILSMSDSNVKIIANMDISADEFKAMLEEHLGVGARGSDLRKGEMKGEEKLSTVTLRGTQGKKVKTGMNIKDINTNMTKQGIAKALKDKLATPLGKEDYSKYGPEGALISPGKLASNTAHNTAVANQPAPQQPQQPQPQKPQAQPKQTANRISGGVQGATADRGKFMSENKDVIDALATGLGISADDVVDAYISGEITDADINSAFDD